MAWQGRSMPQGWGDSQPCTDSARIDVSDAQVGTKKQALRSNQETDERKLRRPGELLDKENPIQGPWCRFRREAPETEAPCPKCAMKRHSLSSAPGRHPLWRCLCAGP